MKIKVLTFVLLSVFFGITCNKPKDEVIERNYSRIALVSTGLVSSGTDSLIIELNSNSTIKSIMSYERLDENVISVQTKSDFYYKPASFELDSSYTETQTWLGITNSYSVKYIYNNGKIVKSYKFASGTGSNIDSIIYSYDSEDRMVDIYRYSKLLEENIVDHTRFEYTGDNLSSITYSSSIAIIPSKTDNWISYDNKRNPFNKLYGKSGYPLMLHLLPSSTALCLNNPTKIEMNGILVNLNYKYNQYNEPIEVISNWGGYNTKIIYEY